MQGLLDGSRIAVFHDDMGTLAAPTAASTVVVYVRDEQDWSEDKRHGFSLTQGAGLAELREQMQGLAANLGGCRIVVGAEDHGALPMPCWGKSGLTARGVLAARLWGRHAAPAKLHAVFPQFAP